MKKHLPYLLTLTLPFATLSCGTGDAGPPRPLTSAEISAFKKNRPYPEAERRQINDYRDQVQTIALRQWRFSMAVWKGSTKPASTHLAFVLSPAGKVEAISTLSTTDPEFAKVTTQAILHCDFPPLPRHLAEIMKDDRNLFECTLDIKAPPKPHVKMKDGLLIYE